MKRIFLLVALLAFSPPRSGAQVNAGIPADVQTVLDLCKLWGGNESRRMETAVRHYLKRNALGYIA